MLESSSVIANAWFQFALMFLKADHEQFVTKMVGHNMQVCYKKELISVFKMDDKTWTKEMKDALAGYCAKLTATITKAAPVPDFPLQYCYRSGNLKQRCPSHLSISQKQQGLKKIFNDKININMMSDTLHNNIQRNIPENPNKTHNCDRIKILVGQTTNELLATNPQLCSFLCHTR